MRGSEEALLSILTIALLLISAVSLSVVPTSATVSRPEESQSPPASIETSVPVLPSASSLNPAFAETSQTIIVQGESAYDRNQTRNSLQRKYEPNNLSSIAIMEKAGTTRIELQLRKLSENIQRQLERKREDEIIRIIVRLEPANLGDVPEIMVVNKLKEHANRTQEPVIEFLQTRGAMVLNKFWLANAILAEAKVSTVRDLTSFSPVRKIHEDFQVRILVMENYPNRASSDATPFREAREDIQVRIPEAEEDYTSHRPSNVPSAKGIREDFQVRIPKVSEDIVISSPTGATWGLIRIRALDAWALGFDGSDIRVAVLDTGVEITHSDLVGKMWTDNLADPTYPGGWIEFDSNGNIVIGSTPHDTDGHGTHTSGTVLGDNASGTAIGVAPGAWLMHALALPGGFGTFPQLVAGMQWTVDPLDQYGNSAGQPANVVSMSFGPMGGGYIDEVIEPIINMKAAGVVPVASIGNDGEGTSGSPGNVYEAFGIGAIDMYDAVATFSGGEVIYKTYWVDPPADWPSSYIKPDFSAPGVSVYSSVPWGYEYWNGTSMAAPHVAGTIALMLNANPALTVDDIYDVLKLTSDDLGDPGKDTRYGWGVIDAFDATNVVQFNSGIQGYVVDALMADGIAGAKVVVQETGWTRYTAENGYYRIFLPPDNYTLTVSAFGYYDNTAAASVVENQLTTLDIALAPLPTGFISGEVTDKALNPVENANITLLGTPLSTRTDNLGNYILEAPIDNYDVKASAWGYRPAFAYGVEVLENQTTFVNFQLEPFIALLIQDLLPWGIDSNSIALKEFEFSYDVINSSTLDTWDLSEYNFIMYSSDQPSSYYVNIANNLNKINSYIIDGGLLIAHSCDGGWNGGDWRGFSILPGGVTHLMYLDGEQYLSQNIHITDPSHEVVTGCGAFTLTDEYLSGWNYSTLGIFTDLVAGTNVVMVSSDNVGDGPTYLDYNYGGGKVLATMQPVEWGYSRIDRPELLRNELRFALKWSPPPHGVMGYVMDVETLSEIAGAEIFIQETGWVTYTLENGYYKIFLPPDNYTLTVSAFRYYDNTVAASVVENQWTTLNITLAPLPTGFISGEVTDDAFNPIENATIALLGTPLSARTDNVGNYALEAPIGSYDVKASAWGYKSATVYDVEVLENQTTVVDFQLEPAIITVVLDSYGTDSASSTFWDYLNTNWATYGSTHIVIDYTSLNKENITLANIEATNADVLIISDAWSSGWEFTDSEIDAIETYVLSGHGIIATSGTFDTWTAPNNQKLAELFGMDPTIWYNWGFNGEQKTTSGTFDLMTPRHNELWRNISDPYLSGPLATLNPLPSSDWTVQGITTGWIEALSTDRYAAVITNEAIHRAVYFTCMLELMGQYNENNRQLFYNAIVWTNPPPFRVSVSISPSENEGLAGENVTFIATVTNAGTVQDNYNLTISDNSGWAPTLSENSLENVQPGENRQVTISVTIPEKAMPGSEDNITVTATSQENAEVSDNASCIARVKVVREVDISISPEDQSGPPGATLLYTVTVTNTGNVEDTYDLNVSDMGWYNASWSYKRPVTIENPGDALENYQVKVFVSHDSDMLENFDDLRFADNDQITELPYWIENYNLAGNATVWIKVPSLPANDNKAIWMYYGNPNASSVSDGDATFEFFDDMESGIEKWVTTGLWHLTMKKSSSPSHSFWYGQEEENNFDTGTANSGSLQTDKLTSALSARLELWYWREVENFPGPYDQTIIYDSVNGSTWNQIWYKDSRDASEKAWTFLAIDLTPSARYLKFYFDTLDSVANDFWGWFIDDVRVRIYALPEPATSVGEEDSYPGWSPSISPASLTLTPGASQNATLSVTIPENAPPDTEDNITVTATSQADSKIKNSATCAAYVITGEWDASITATFSVGSDDAVFGVRPDATSGFDNAYDIPEPPPPVAPPYVRTFFYYPGQIPDELHRSSLAPENLMEWPLRVEYAEGSEDITLTWSVEEVPAVYSVFLYRGENLVADMRAEDNYTFEASTGSYDFRIVVGELLPFTLELTQGWNMISFPVLPENSSPDAIFGSYYVLYRWDAEKKQYVLHADSGGFIEPDPDVEAGVGYWAYVLENENVNLLGVPVNRLTLSPYQGWNLIGPPYGGSSIADPADDPDNSVLPWAFTWNSREKSYSMTQLLEAGKGYWAYALRDCTLTLLPSKVAPSSAILTITAENTSLTASHRKHLEPSRRISMEAKEEEK